MSDIKGNYPPSKNGNFTIIDTIGVPHPYCIGAKHMKYNKTMMLDIPYTETLGARCCICESLFKHGKR